MTYRTANSNDSLENGRICIPNAQGEISGTVWRDVNGSGRKGNDETGLGCVTVVLSDNSGCELARTETESNGSYSFSGLSVGTYRVAVDSGTLPDGYQPTYDLDGGRDHQTAVPLAPGETEDQVDFGYQPSYGSIGDQVWLEEDGKKKGIPGVAVTIANAAGTLCRTMQTSPEGLYRFHNLPPGRYTVSLDPDTLPRNAKQTYDRDGNLDHQTTVDLYEGQNVDDADFGYRERRRWWLLPLALLGWLAFLLLLLYCCRPTPPQTDLVIEVEALQVQQQYACEGVIVAKSAVQVTVRNVGNLDADSFVITLNDHEETVAALAAGESATFSFAMPETAILTAIADPTEQIAESNENNNRDTLNVTLETIPAADFACQPELAVVIGTQCDNEAISLWAHVGNYGVVDVADPVLHINGQPVAVGTLAAGEQQTLVDLAWDENEAVTAVIDPNNAIAESNEDNNEHTIQVNKETCSAPLAPELSVELIASCVDAQTAVVRAIAINSGGRAAEQVEMSLNGSLQTIGDLAPATAKTLSFMVQSDAITAVIDPDNQVAEADESNNAATASVDFAPCQTVLPVDLTVSITATSEPQCPATAAADVAVTVTNLGKTAVGEFALTIGDETELISGLGGGKSLTFERTMTASSITAVVDANNQIAESDESNNEATTTVTVTNSTPCLEPQPDLTVALGCAVDPLAETYTITVAASNDNVTAVDHFRLQLNEHTAVINGLAKGANAQRSFTFPIGTANFIARVDAASQIAESNETNNQSVLYIDRLPSSHSCKMDVDYEGCTRIDFEIGRQAVTGVRQEGMFVVREAANGRFVTSWRARVGEVDSDLMHHFSLSRSEVHVTVDFVPDSGNPIRMEILNPAPGTPYGWLSEGICHALEVQYPARS